VLAAGKQWTFTAPAIAPPSGLYRAVADVRNAKVVGGWIVLPDGSQVGVVTTNDVPAAAAPLTLPAGTTTVDGTTITAAAVTGPIS
jgi:serine/threonine-protein kinase